MSAISLAKRAISLCGLDPNRLYQQLSAASLGAAIAEQGLAPLVDRLRAVLPDIADQYTDGFDRAEYDRYWECKMRGMHAFQVQCMLDVVDLLNRDNLVLADIGDSSGNHALYLKALAKPGQVARVISVNLDPVAIDKVKAKGGDAILCRAEELDLGGIRPDLFLSFEMVEHLTDPIRFLHALATKGAAEYLLFTVPLRRKSRFGGVEVRLPDHRLPARMTPEQVHTYEFCPEEWRLLARFAGFSTVWTRTYLQYPRRSPLRLTAPVWRSLDFEGFVAFLCRRDLNLASRYTGW